MNKLRECLQEKRIMLAMVFGVFCATMSLGLSYLFPQGDQWLPDWQTSQWAHQSVDQSITLIEADDSSVAVCGEGQWNLDTLQDTMVALHQAGASVIAPMLEVSLPVVSECGGLQAFVRLAEVTRQAKSVVYPEAVPSALVHAATRTGFSDFRFNERSMARNEMLPAKYLSSSHVPFGIAVASALETAPAVPINSFLPNLRATGRLESIAFPRHQFTDIWQLVQAGKRAELSRYFQGKIVFLYLDVLASISSPAVMSPGALSALSHANLANAYLTNSWFVPVPFVLSILMTFSLSCLVIVVIFGAESLPRFRFILGVMLLLVGVLFFLGVQWGWMWPLCSMLLTVVLTSVGMGVWKIWLSRSSIDQEIVQREQQLALLEHELSEKQGHVQQLETRLNEAQHRTKQSGAVIEELTIARHTARAQLDQYHHVVQETRQKIASLQEELQDLRQHVPVTSVNGSSETLTVENQELIHQSETFNIVTRDSAVLRLFHNLKKAAATQVPILLLGETGTGKEVFAKAAHALSPRRQGPFISVNMAAIRGELFEGELFGHVKGAFTGAIGRTGFLESAHNGTLFLDEVGDLPLDLQAKLLRFLEDGGFHRVGQSAVTHVDVRIVAATNRDLQDQVRSGRYREDLYYRLRSLVLTLPPLRERGSTDRVLLAQMFLQQCAQSQGRTDLSFTKGALDAIVTYRWPGNVRELRQTVAQAVALANQSVISEAELNLDAPDALVQEENWVIANLGHREDVLVLECLRRHNFEMQTTAASLGWDRGTVTQRLKGLGFQALMDYQGDFHAAASALAGDEQFVTVMEGRLREYTKNLLPTSKSYGTVEEAIADCRKRFRNLPDRHFPAVEHLLHERFAAQ